MSDTVFPACVKCGVLMKVLGSCKHNDIPPSASQTYEQNIAEHVGYYVWDEKLGGAFRGKLHRTPESARAALGGIVWHSRDRYAIRSVMVGAVEPSSLSSRIADFSAAALAASPTERPE